MLRHYEASGLMDTRRAENVYRSYSGALMRAALVFVLAAIVITYLFDNLAPALALFALAVWAVLGGIGASSSQTILCSFP